MKFGLKVSALVLGLAQLAASKKVFIDNDGLAPLQVLFPLMAGWEIVGITSSFGSSSLVDAVGAASDILELYNLTSCIPNYLGAAGPLLRNNQSFHQWESMFGDFVWEGAYAGTYEDAYTWDNVTYKDTMGAVALIEAVKANKDTDPVYIYAAGMMTLVAQAISLYPQLVEESAGLYIMGGYFDTQYAQATGSSIVNDINTDINLIQDPEAAQIVLTQDWKELYIGANVTNYLVPSQELYNTLISKAGGYSNITDNPYLEYVYEIVYSGNYTENEIESDSQETLPFWDEVVSAFMVWPEMVLGSINVSTTVDTQFYSPFYGSLRIWGNEYAPTAAQTGNATVVTQVDDSAFYGYLIDAFFKDWRQYCEVGGPVALAGYD